MLSVAMTPGGRHGHTQGDSRSLVWDSVTSHVRGMLRSRRSLSMTGGS